MAVRHSVSVLLRTRFVAALSEPRGVDHYLGLFSATWSAREVRARVVGVHRETSDTVSLLLVPNSNWRSFHAGQHVQLSATIDGIRHTRTFSISSSPRSDAPLRITIRTFPGGVVSGWAFHRARRGDVVVLGPPQGEFVMSPDSTAHVLCISGGSGITPVMSIVHELLHSDYSGEISWLHYARKEVPFLPELEALVREFPSFKLVTHLTGEEITTGKPRPRLSLEALQGAHPSWQQCEAFVCGPAALERAATDIWSEHGSIHRLHIERFQAPAMPAFTPDVDTATAPRRLVFAKSGVSAQGHGAASLLEQAEAAGLRPAHGCRMGICHTCKCVKRSGVVRNVATGEISSGENETIQLCTNTPLSDVTLEL